MREWDLAEIMAHQKLEHIAACGCPHLALALVLEHKNAGASAAREFAAAESYWPEADVDLPEPVRTKKGSTSRLGIRRF